VARRTNGIAARALAARVSPPQPVENLLRFRVSGSTGTPYDMLLHEKPGNGPTLFCSCPGARFRGQCRHVKALSVGDYRALLVSGEDERRQLATMLSSVLSVAKAA
jgi:DNA polymerase III subunit epsilon